MPDIIKILPDSVANQIAAGEVIQRPASVVKELVENSVDANATKITVNIKDSGKTLIQIIDDGKGMSETDARIAFERHSTSKINVADDLFSLHTKGFRGEALASIASVAQVELNTRNEESQLGTKIIIEGSQLILQQDVNCAKGANFSIKNLFYNVPARRKFLKGTNTEFTHIITEFQRIALAHPDISFSLFHNEKEIYVLPQSNLKQRIINVFGKTINQNVTAVNSETAFVNIYGFIGKPEIARKQYGQQFFFVNNRFFKNTYFHKAITLGYDQIIANDSIPTYFIYFDIAPETIDVNIHPTKTEINFENASAIFQLLISAVKETLGKHNIVPSIDFDQEGAFEIPYSKKNSNIKMPQIQINENYNPFENEKKSSYDFHKNISTKQLENDNLSNWEKLYSGINNNKQPEIFNTSNNFENIGQQETQFFQVKNKYILTTVKSGLMIIDQKRAHEKILYNKYFNKITSSKNSSQQTLYPIKIDFNSEDLLIFEEIYEILVDIGFSFEQINTSTYYITGSPTFLENKEPDIILYDFLANFTEYEIDIKNKILEGLALSFSKSMSINYNKSLNKEEMLQIFDELFASASPNYTYDGKTIISMLKYEDLDKMF